MSEPLVIKDRYRLGTRIGVGGMAEVFRATVVGASGFSREVAIKRVLPAHAAEPVVVEMFTREARITAGLRHPNIVSVLDFDQDEDGNLFLAMELVEGTDLHTLIRALPPGTRLPFHVVLYTAVEVLRGLGHAHDARDAGGRALHLVHRDMSSKNVLLAWTGEVKIADFGLVKVSVGSLQSTGTKVKGTLDYMSPEQVQGVPIDRRSDLFAVGVLLYEMLTGIRPFQRETSTATLAALLLGKVTPPGELRPDIPAGMDAIAMRLLHREREQRYDDAQAVIDALLACEAVSPRGRDDLSALLHEHCAPQRTDSRAAGDVLVRKPEPASRAPAPHAPPPMDRARMAAGQPRTQSIELLVHGEAGPARPGTRKARMLLVLLLGGIVALWVLRDAIFPRPADPGQSPRIEESPAPAPVEHTQDHAVPAPRPPAPRPPKPPGPRPRAVVPGDAPGTEAARDSARTPETRAEAEPEGVVSTPPDYAAVESMLDRIKRTPRRME